MPAAIAEGQNVFFCCFCLQSLRFHRQRRCCFNSSILVTQPCGNLPLLHSWSSPRSRHKHHQKLPPEHCGDQRWSWTKSLKGKTQNVSVTKPGKPSGGHCGVWESHVRKNTVTANHTTHLPTRLPCKPSPLQSPCGPVPEGFQVLAASPGCQQCAPRCWKEETGDRHGCVLG